MFGNMGMGGGMPMPPANAGAMPQSPAVPPSGINQPNPMMMGNGNFLSDIFNALMNPQQAAVEMAKNGISPNDFSEKIGGSKLTDLMAQQSKNTQKPVSGIFGDQPMIDRGGYDLPKLGASQRGPDQGTSVASLMNPLPQGMMEQQDQNQVQRTNDLFTPGGRIVQPGPDHPEISAATPDNFITMKDVLDLFASETPGFGQPQMPLGSTIQNVDQRMPVIPPVTPTLPQNSPGANLPPQPINPPVVPPVDPNMPNIADYTSGKIKTGVMGSAGGNAPDTQLSGNSAFNEFMNTLKAGGLTNANGLAAAAATAKSESGFDTKNIFGNWNDPSEKGVSGTSGGVMSWREERYRAMKAFVEANGGDSVSAQAKFFLQEDPNLIAKLNAAKSPEEAQQLMNNAWRFAGYDKPGGEAGRRIALARNFAASGSFGDGGPISGAPQGIGTTAAGAGTPAAAQGLTQRLASATSGLTDPGSSQPDLNLPDAPSPVAPRPGQYSPDPNMMKLMLMMLTGGGGGGIPSLTQLMSGRA